MTPRVPVEAGHAWQDQAGAPLTCIEPREEVEVPYTRPADKLHRTIRSTASTILLTLTAWSCDRSARAEARATGSQPVDVPHRTDSVVTRGGVVHFSTAGKGPVVILLSGGPGYSGTFLEPVHSHLARRYRAVLVDQRGTGRSSSFVDSTGFTLANSVDDIERVRQRLGVEQVVLLGHSWGGVLAMAYASTYPAHVAGLVLVGSGTLRPALTNAAISQRLAARLTQADLDSIRTLSAVVPDPARRADALRRIRLLNWKAYEHDPASVNALAKRLTPQSFNEETARWMYSDLLREGPRFATRLAAVAGLRAIPVLIVYGAVDPVGTTTIAELRSVFPQATIQVIPRSGHHPWIESPAAFHAAVDTFLIRRR